MNMNKHLALAFVALLCILISGCASVTDKLTIHGMVYDCNNQPAGNYQIFLNGVMAGITDIGGRFDIEVYPGNYILTGSGYGYGSIEQPVALYDQKQTVYLRVETLDSILEKAVTALEYRNSERAVSILEPSLSANENNTEFLYVLAAGYLLCGDKYQAAEIIEKINQIGIRENKNGEYELLITAMNN